MGKYTGVGFFIILFLVIPMTNNWELHNGFFEKTMGGAVNQNTTASTDFDWRIAGNGYSGRSLGGNRGGHFGFGGDVAR